MQKDKEKRIFFFNNSNKMTIRLGKMVLLYYMAKVTV